MKLYFGNAVTAATTIMIAALLAFIGYSVFNHANIQFWGRRSLLVAAFGLVVCCFAAARDGLEQNHSERHRRPVVSREFSSLSAFLRSWAQ